MRLANIRECNAQHTSHRTAQCEGIHLTGRIAEDVEQWKRLTHPSRKRLREESLKVEQKKEQKKKRQEGKGQKVQQGQKKDEKIEHQVQQGQKKDEKIEHQVLFKVGRKRSQLDTLRNQKHQQPRRDLNISSLSRRQNIKEGTCREVQHLARRRQRYP